MPDSPATPPRTFILDPAVAALPEELQRLLRIVAMAANEATGTRAAIQSCLEAVTAFTGWPLGHAFIRDDEGDSYRSAGVWQVEPADAFPRFREASAATVLTR